LPDALASRLSGTLAEVETVIDTVERASSLAAAAEELRPDIELPGAIRWVRRRVNAIRQTLTTLIGLFPDLFLSLAPTLPAFRKTLSTKDALSRLRQVAAAELEHLCWPVGFGHHQRHSRLHVGHDQQSTGPDPP
jgi:hypothetical protein